MKPFTLLVNAVSPWINAHQQLALLICFEWMFILSLVAAVRYFYNSGGIGAVVFMTGLVVLVGVVMVYCGAWDNLVYGEYDNDSLALGVVLLCLFCPLVSMPEPYAMRSGWGVGKLQCVFYIVILSVLITLLPIFVPISV